MLVLLQVAGLENLARVQTRATLSFNDSDTAPPYNMAFRLALSASVYIGLGKGRQTDAWTDGQTYSQVDGHTGGQMDSRLNRYRRINI